MDNFGQGASSFFEKLDAYCWSKSELLSLVSKNVFFYFKGSFFSFIFDFEIFWSKAKLIFGQFRAILLLGPSKSGHSLWVKKWITMDYYRCDGGAAAAGEGEGEGKRFRNCLM